MHRKKIISVVGARPNFMKVAPLHRAFAKYDSKFQHMIVHTGQHYDRSMSKVFFEDLGLPDPDMYLGVGSGTHAEQTAKVMVEFEKVLLKKQPDLVVVVGDVNSTVACSLVSVKLNIPVAHVEAGLRSFDRTMPEEINRLLTDTIAEYLFVSERSGLVNLRREGVDEKKVSFVGNVMIDSLIQFRQRAQASTLWSSRGLKEKEFVLVTLHRPSNVDDRENLGRILELFRRLDERTTVVFPIHPRTRKMLAEFGLEKEANAIRKLMLLEPVGYLDFLSMMEKSALVITDSGGIQEETTFLGVPCLTLRENTERPVTVEQGTNELCGHDFDVAAHKSVEAIEGRWKKGSVPEMWDGKTAERIARTLAEKLG